MYSGATSKRLLVFSLIVRVNVSTKNCVFSRSYSNSSCRCRKRAVRKASHLPNTPILLIHPIFRERSYSRPLFWRHCQIASMHFPTRRTSQRQTLSVRLRYLSTQKTIEVSRQQLNVKRNRQCQQLTFRPMKASNGVPRSV